MTTLGEERQHWLGVRVAPLMFTAGTTLGTARAAMEGAGAHEAIVMQDDRPLGVVTIADVHGPADAALGDVMQWECVRIDAAADGLTTVRAFRDAAWKSLRRPRPGRCLDRGPARGPGSYGGRTT